jgi:putative membrane protein insertion efficiency factor
VIGHRNPIRTLLVWCVRGYQVFISPGLPGRCRYYPSCSQYAIDALREYGVLRGFVLASWRLLRCNPLSHGGYDPVQRQTLFAPRGRVGRLAGDPSGDVSGDGDPRSGPLACCRNGLGDKDDRVGTSSRRSTKLTAGRTT